MSHSWTLYTEVSTDRALTAIEAALKALEALIGSDTLKGYLDDDNYPDELGAWPTFEPAAGPIPTPAEERELLEEPNKIGVRFEEAALTRLGKCKSRVDIESPTDFKRDPTLVSAIRLLVGKLGPCVFSQNAGFDLVTSETLLKSLAKATDLEAALEDLEEDEEGEEDEEDEDRDEEDEDEEPNEEEIEDAKAVVIHRSLGAMAGNPKVRRRAMELLQETDPDVGKLAAVIAQRGPADDDRLSLWSGMSKLDVADARIMLARLLNRAQDGR